jgi:hypothetical protein
MTKPVSPVIPPEWQRDTPVAPASELVPAKDWLRQASNYLRKNGDEIFADCVDAAAAELPRKDEELAAANQSLDYLWAELIPDLNNQLAIAQARIAELEKRLGRCCWPDCEQLGQPLSPEAKGGEG